MKKTFVKTLSTLFPNQAATFAYKQLTNPQIKKLRPNELKVLDKAEKENFQFKDFDIQTYRWQGGIEKILLVHGWEGQAGNFADLIEKLVKQNYTVNALDGPSHGFSSKGRTSLFEFTELAGILIRKFGVYKLISHSFGAVAVTYALVTNPDLKIDKYVLLATPDKFLERIEDVCKKIGITENALIIHDKNDTVVPINRARNVYNNWRVCEFIEIEGTGHFRILRTKSVLDKTLEFLDA